MRAPSGMKAALHTPLLCENMGDTFSDGRNGYSSLTHVSGLNTGEGVGGAWDESIILQCGIGRKRDMQAIADFLHTLGPWNWFIIAGIFLALETLIPGVYLLWFGLAALIVGLVAFATGAAWQAQIVLFAVVAVAFLFLVRRLMGTGRATTDSPALNVRGAQYVGHVFTVEEAITGGRGKIRVGDTVWLAKGPDLPKGARVEVKGVDGTMLVVEATA